MKKVYILSIFFFCIFIANAQEQSIPTSFPEASQFSDSKFTYKIIDGINKTFGYDIYVDGKLIIHQPSIPAMQGNEGFKIKPDAEKVAELVIVKIKKGEMPPTVSSEELKKLEVVK